MRFTRSVVLCTDLDMRRIHNTLARGGMPILIALFRILTKVSLYPLRVKTLNKRHVTYIPPWLNEVSWHALRRAHVTDL